MSIEELVELAMIGDVAEVARMVDERGVEVDSKNRVCVFLLLLAHLGAVWDRLEQLLS